MENARSDPPPPRTHVLPFGQAQVVGWKEVRTEVRDAALCLEVPLVLQLDDEGIGEDLEQCQYSAGVLRKGQVREPACTMRRGE